MRRSWPLVLAVALAACGPTATGGATPLPSPSASATPTPTSAGRTLSAAELKYRLLDELGRLAFCDPDFFPLARGDEAETALARFPEIQKDQETLAAIVAHLNLPLLPPYTRDQQLAIYRDWKVLNAIRIESSGAFQIRVYPVGQTDQRTTTLVEGVIDTFGRIAVRSRTPGARPNCPICLAHGTRIATPNGAVAVEDLRVGMSVWTADAAGVRVAAVVLELGSAFVPADHEVVQLALSDGRRVRVSPGHPTSDGRRVGDLRAGDRYDGATVTSAERVRYGEAATFDLLPSGPTGTYWADSVLLGSTLR